MTDVADDILIHYGKKGMRWGVRNERRKEAATKLVDRKKARMEKGKNFRAKTYEAKKEAYKKVGGIGKEQSDQIKAARERQKGRLQKLQDADDVYMVSGSKAAHDLMKKHETEYLKHPDAKTARKMTRGEATATGVLVLVGAVSAYKILKTKPPSALATYSFKTNF